MCLARATTPSTSKAWQLQISIKTCSASMRRRSRSSTWLTTTRSRKWWSCTRAQEIRGNWSTCIEDARGAYLQECHEGWECRGTIILGRDLRATCLLHINVALTEVPEKVNTCIAFKHCNVNIINFASMKRWKPFPTPWLQCLSRCPLISRRRCLPWAPWTKALPKTTPWSWGT